MNAPRKKSAIAAYQEQFKAGEDVMALLANDEKNYIDAEIKEIMAALEAGEGDAPQLKGKEEKTTGNLNKVYEEWKVKPAYEDITDAMGKVIGRKLTSFEKDAQKPIRVTSITPDKAELLNEQSENTLLRLYEAK